VEVTPRPTHEVPDRPTVGRMVLGFEVHLVGPVPRNVLQTIQNRFGDVSVTDEPWLRAGAGALWCDVLVQVEEVAGIVGPLNLNQAVIVLTVVVLNLAIIVVLHEVYVAAGF
jgi:hypothetical protein